LGGAEIIAAVPATASSGPLVVNASSQSSIGDTFEVPHPAISGVTPPGGVISIQGLGFARDFGGVG
jgi:hypothetical protein